MAQKYFDFRDLRHMSHGRVPVIEEFDEDKFLHGVRPLSEQIRSFRKGVQALDTHKIPDAFYDEDDETQVDPSFDPELDRFERAEALADRISERMKKQKEESLQHADA